MRYGSELRRLSCPHHDATRRTAAHIRACENAIGPLGKTRPQRNGARPLFDGKAFARQRRFAHITVAALDHSGIRSHEAAGRKGENVAGTISLYGIGTLVPSRIARVRTRIRAFNADAA